MSYKLKMRVLPGVGNVHDFTKTGCLISTTVLFINMDDKVTGYSCICPTDKSCLDPHWKDSYLFTENF